MREQSGPPVIRRPTAHPTSRQAIADRMKLIRMAISGDHHGAQKSFSKLVGIRESTWSNYEAGTNQISVKFALRLCNATEVGLNYIYRGTIADMSDEMRGKIEKLKLK